MTPVGPTIWKVAPSSRGTAAASLAGRKAPFHHPSTPPEPTTTPDAGSGDVVVVESSVSVGSVEGELVVAGAVEAEAVAAAVVATSTVVETSLPAGEHPTDIVASMQIPNPVAFFRNWSRSDLTTEEKLRQAVKNAAIKARTGEGCCGNHGEVGC
jgi:hypothetical protein